MAHTSLKRHHGCDPESVEAELERILASRQFAGCRRLSRFLAHCVHAALQGTPELVREANLARLVFDRGEEFDARLDPIVRVQAIRLRKKLAEYYRTAGRRNPLRIEMHRGSYLPLFRRVPVHAAASARQFPREIAVTAFRSSGDSGMDWTAESLPLMVACELARAGVPAAACQSRRRRAPAAQGRLDGFVWRQRAQIILEARLRNADGALIWTGRFSVPGEPSLAVAEQLARHLVQAVRLERVRRANEAAVRSLSFAGRCCASLKKAWHYLFKEDPASLQLGLELCLESLSRDPQPGRPGYAGLAYYYLASALQNYLPPQGAFLRAREMARRAMRAGESLSHAHALLGWVALLAEWRPSAAESEALTALREDPHSRTARKLLALTASLCGRHEEAFVWLRDCRKLDPFSPRLSFIGGIANLLRGDLEGAQAGYAEELRLYPHFLPAALQLAEIALARDRPQEASEAIARLRRLYNNDSRWLAMQGRVFARMGAMQEAVAILDRLRDQAARSSAPAFALWQLSLALSREEEATGWLERAVETREPWVLIVDVLPQFEHMRQTRVYGAIRTLLAEFRQSNR